jgi:mannosyltransferase
MFRILTNKIKNVLITDYLLLIILLLGLILRLISINQSLWLDEAISVLLVKKASFLVNLSYYMKGDFNPPLFNLILYFWLKVVPTTEFFIRLPSLFFGLLTCFLVYKIYKLIFKESRGTLLSLALLVTAPLHIYYSQEARMYSLASFSTSASLYYFLQLIKTKKKFFTFHFSLFTILMLYSHYLAWLILLVQWLYLILIKFWKDKKLFLNILISNILIFFFLIPLTPFLFNQLKVGQRVALKNVVWGDVVGRLSFKNLALLPLKFIIGRTSFANKNLYYSIGALLVLCFVLLLWKARKEAKLIWLWLILPPILGAFISIKVPVFSYFRFLFCLPAFYLLVSRGVSGCKNPKPYIVSLLVINLFFSSLYLFNTNFHRENWKEAVRVLHSQNLERNPVLIEENVTAPFLYYDQGKSDLVYTQQKELIMNRDTVWLIPYAQPIFDPKNETRIFLETNGFSRIYEEHFRGVTLEKWQKLLAFSYN